MAIVQPFEMDFSKKKFSMIICGPPGVGKTTLALSAPQPVLVDFDHGVSRVSAKHRRPTILCQTYDEVLRDLQSDVVQQAETIVIDTGGSLVTYLQAWAVKQSPANAQSSGALSLKGFGAVKSEFIRFNNWLQYTMDKNILYIFHTVEEKDPNGGTIQRIMCEGAARNIVWQPCDLGCYLHMVGEERYAGFSPTEQYFAKGCFGIRGLLRIPTLTEEAPNDFLTRLFAKARANIEQEGDVIYQQAIQVGASLIKDVKSPDDLQDTWERVQALTHSSTSLKELRDMLTKKAKTWGYRYAGQPNAYVRA